MSKSSTDATSPSYYSIVLAFCIARSSRRGLSPPSATRPTTPLLPPRRCRVRRWCGYAAVGSSLEPPIASCLPGPSLLRRVSALLWDRKSSMSLLKQPPATTSPHCQQIAMAPARKSIGGTSGSAGKDVKQRVHLCMNKLADRDTEALGASELESMAMDLPAESLPSFLSAISDTRSSDKTPLRRHCVRLLSLLSRTRQPQSLAPFLPRMLAAVLRRIRDPDSSVRAACVDAVRDMCRCSASSFCVVFLKPLSESLLLEQDVNAQVASAMCLAAAIDEVSFAAAAEENRGARGHELAQHLPRLVPRLAKLAKSDSFKAKPALLSLIGSFIAAGGASTASLLGILIPCLVDALAVDDWAARKAAAEALTRVAAIPDSRLLASFKSSYLSSFQARRFDKVKIVRESMNQMLDAWKNVPGALVEEDAGRGGNSQSSQSPSCSVQKGNVTDGEPLAGARTSSFNQSATPPARKMRSPVNLSSPSDVLTTPTRRTTPSNGKRMHQPILSNSNYEKPSDWKIEISSPQAPPSTIVSRREVLNDKERGGKVFEQCMNEENSGSRQKVKKLAFENSEARVNKLGYADTGSHVIPCKENGLPDHTVESDNVLTGNKDSELCVIRKQLVQIENQQSSLLNLLQRFIGNSQNGIHSLEARVQGLEMALDELCHDLSVCGRVPNADPTVHCCKIPGAQFLSSKLWRRAEGRDSSKLSNSSSLSTVKAQNSKDKSCGDFLKGGKQTFGDKGGFVINPLAEVNSHSRSTDASPKGMQKSIMNDNESQHTQGSSRNDGIRTVTQDNQTFTGKLRLGLAAGTPLRRR